VGDLPNHTVVGVRVAQQLPRVPLSIYGGLDNVFDEAYEESYGFPQSGRVAYIGLDVQL
jgi:outer membrane cobalamin receptor